jgi:hypothetical protein
MQPPFVAARREPATSSDLCHTVAGCRIANAQLQRGTLIFVRRFASRLGATFPTVLDPRGRTIARRWQVSTMPTSVIVDCGGIVRHVHEGFRSRDAATIESEVDALMASCDD